MEISLSMILELLKQPYNNHIRLADRPCFHGVKLLTTPAEPHLKTDILYIATQKLAERLYASGRRFYSLCTPDRERPKQDAYCPYPMAVLKEDADTEEVYHRVEEIFERLKTWDFSLYTTLLGKGSLQQLINCSQEILCSHIHVVEPFSRLLAYTKDIDIDDEDIKSFYSKFLDKPGTLPRLQSMILEKARAAENGMYVMEDDSLFAHPSITRALNFGSSYTIFAIMICKSAPASEGIQDLFLHLCKYIRLQVENRPSAQQLPGSQEIFINGILDGTLSRNAANVHATLSLKLPMKSNFNLYKVVLTGKQKQFDKVMKAVSQALPHSRLSRYQDGIVVLNHYEQPNFTRSHRSNQKALQPVLEKYGAVCGTSNPFHTLYEMTAAYEQASIVLEYYGNGKVQRSFPFMPSPQDGIFYCFDDYTLCHFFLETGDKNPRLFLLNPYRDSIIAIKDYDTRHSTRYLETLYFYLTNERSLTAVSEYLHVSKEKVGHSIHSIEPLIFGKLDCWQIRLKLLLAFEYLNLHPEEL